MSDITLSDRVNDIIRSVENTGKAKYIGFLTPNETGEISHLLKCVNHKFFGGYDGAERVYLGVYPEWDDICEDFPVVPLTFSFNDVYSLSHRDFLGTLMSLGIKRRAVGDILIESGRAVVFLCEDISQFVLNEITKVGGVGVKITTGISGDLPNMSKPEDLSTTVPSLRLDAVISSLCGKSRNGAVSLIHDGMVTVNSVGAVKSTATIHRGDTISVRKHGKFIITSCNEQTKKARIIINYKKY